MIKKKILISCFGFLGGVAFTTSSYAQYQKTEDELFRDKSINYCETNLAAIYDKNDEQTENHFVLQKSTWNYEYLTSSNIWRRGEAISELIFEPADNTFVCDGNILKKNGVEATSEEKRVKETDLVKIKFTGGDSSSSYRNYKYLSVSRGYYYLDTRSKSENFTLEKLRTSIDCFSYNSWCTTTNNYPKPVKLSPWKNWY